MAIDSTTPTAKPRQRVVRGLVAALVTAALVSLGIWVGASYLKDSDGVTPAESELTASQHILHLVRSLRVSAASNVTLEHIETIPEATAGHDPLECGSRFALALEDAAIQLYRVDYLSSVAGSRSADVESWRVQQSQAHDGAVALRNLFPDECLPQIPVVFDLKTDVRFSHEISIRQVLLVSDDLVDQWSQLYLLAESAEERNIALAGLWQVLRWEAAALPGRSPFAFDW